MKLASSSNALGFDLYGQLRTAPGNLAFSPASISAALAMTFGGARGETEAQMKRVLHFDGGRDAAMSGWGNLSRQLQDPARPLKLRMANRLFGRSENPRRTATAFSPRSPAFPPSSCPPDFPRAACRSAVEFLGRAFSEPTLLKLAYAYEQGTKHRRPPPSAP